MTDCTGKAAHPATSIDIQRMIGLTTAAGMLGGQERLADALGILPRSLRAKLSANRGVSNGELEMAARALDARADQITGHARKLRAVAGEGQ